MSSDLFPQDFRFWWWDDGLLQFVPSRCFFWPFGFFVYIVYTFMPFLLLIIQSLLTYQKKKGKKWSAAIWLKNLDLILLRKINEQWFLLLAAIRSGPYLSGPMLH